MVFTLAPATETDTSTLAGLFYQAFAKDELNQTISPPLDAEKTKARIENLTKRFVHAMKHDPSYRVVKITDEDTKQIIAFAGWNVPSTDPPVEKDEIPFAEGTNVELLKDFKEKTKIIKGKHMNTETDYYLHVLATLPAYQGKGAGRMLLRWGLDQVDKDGTKAYVEASPYALEIYKKYGWKEVDYIEHNLGDWDKSKVGKISRTVCLLRPIMGSKTI